MAVLGISAGSAAIFSYSTQSSVNTGLTSGIVVWLASLCSIVGIVRNNVPFRKLCSFIMGFAWASQSGVILLGNTNAPLSIGVSYLIIFLFNILVYVRLKPH
jgi:hypothetical protein